MFGEKQLITKMSTYTIKYRGAWGRDSFLQHLVNTLNELLF